MVHMVPSMCNSNGPEGLARVEFCTSLNWWYMWSIVCVYTMESSWNRNSNTLEPDRTHCDYLAAC